MNKLEEIKFGFDVKNYMSTCVEFFPIPLSEKNESGEEINANSRYIANEVLKCGSSTTERS